LKAKRSVIVIAIIGRIAIIAVIHDCISFTVVPDDEEPFEEPCDEPAGTRTPLTPDVSPLHTPPPPQAAWPAPPLRQRAMAQLRPVSVPAVTSQYQLDGLQ
jgi:hypothetical protein